MASVNKVIIIGNLGADPEMRYLGSGDAVANIRVATSERWKDKSGEQQEHTEWHRIAFFGKLAEIAGEYLKKGSSVYIEGKLQTRKWQKDGVDQYSTEIRADRMQMLGGRGESSGEREPAAAARSSSSGAGGANAYRERKGGSEPRQAELAGAGRGAKPAAKRPDPFEGMDDDIPF